MAPTGREEKQKKHDVNTIRQQSGKERVRADDHLFMYRISNSFSPSPNPFITHQLQSIISTHKHRQVQKAESGTMEVPKQTIIILIYRMSKTHSCPSPLLSPTLPLNQISTHTFIKGDSFLKISTPPTKKRKIVSYPTIHSITFHSFSESSFSQSSSYQTPPSK